MGTAFVHSVLDDHSRVAYSEIHDDETARTACAVLRRAVLWFAGRGVTSGPSSAPTWTSSSRAGSGGRPQTNGKIERFHRTMTNGWAFRRLYTSESARRHALPGWIHEYNHHRLHGAIGKATPISRLTNLPGSNTSLVINNVLLTHNPWASTSADA